jgi:hypothetical protein
VITANTGSRIRIVSLFFVRPRRPNAIDRHGVPEASDARWRPKSHQSAGLKAHVGFRYA